MSIISKGFGKFRRSVNVPKNLLPPGQYLENNWPVLTYGPTPQINKKDWQLEVVGEVENPYILNWNQLQSIGIEEFVCDIHCVTKWSKFNNHFKGVRLEKLLEKAKVKKSAKFLLQHSYGGYTTNIPLAESLGDQAFLVFEYDGKPLASEHGGPARIVIPHLYFWKSAKWVNKLELLTTDQLGFWEVNGYHAHGDPWKEERYS